MFKRGQHWSLELMLALGVFMVIFVFLVSLSAYTPNESDSEELITSSRVMMSLIERDIGLIQGNEVNKEKLDELSDLSKEEIAQLFGATGSVCIHLVDLDGNLVDNKTIGFDVGGKC